MNEQDKQTFANQLMVLSEVFGKEVSKPLARIYFESLAEYSIDQVTQAINKHIKTGKFFPKPVELTDIINGGKPNTQDKALLAWLSIIDAMKKLGAYRALTVNDRLALEVVKQIGGYTNLCSLTYKELEFKKREFVEVYTSIEKIDEDLLPKSLQGLHDKSNENKQALLANKDVK